MTVLRLGVHDASRLEWIAELPFPDGDRADDFELELSAEVPAHVWTAHDHWERLQLLARLSSPGDEPGGNLLRLTSVDELRRSALAVVHRAKEEQARVEQRIFDASSLLSAAPDQALADGVLDLLGRGLRTLRTARDKLGSPLPSEPSDITHERALAQEFLSNHAIELVAQVERAVEAHLLGPRCRHKEYAEAVARIRSVLAHELAGELAWRGTRGFTSPGEGNPWELERYVGRVSVLKKHFQGLLFLDVKAELADHRFKSWLGVAAAALGALAYFPLATLLMGGHGVTGVGLGLTGSAIVVTVIYGLRERVKDAAKSWLSRRVTESFGERAATMSTPGRLVSDPLKLLRVRESFSVSHEKRADPQHPDLGKTMPMVRLRYRMRGTIQGDRRLAWHGSERAKLVFRYDLSPLFARLDDPIKEVPILSDDGDSLRFTDAARCYRIPVSLRLRRRGSAEERGGVLVAHKLGLERLEPLRAPEDPDPAAAIPPTQGFFASVPGRAMRRL